MATISLCMIVKDAEESLPYCLYTIKDIVDEIIIVDMGSSDKTKEVAKKFTENIFDYSFDNDYSKVRNFSFSKATKDFILWLDASDIVLDLDRFRLMDLKKRLDENIDVVMMKYNFGTEKNEHSQVLATRERLVRRANNYLWMDKENEYIKFSGNVLYEDITITNRKVNFTGNKYVKLYKEKVDSGEEISNKGNFYYARELYFQNDYEEAIKKFEEFLYKDEGYVEEKINGLIMLSKAYKGVDNSNKALESLVRTFIYDAPTAEVCCELGYHYKEKKEIKKAIQWFRIANTIDKPSNYLFSEQDYYDFIPYMELSNCYYAINNIGMTKFYHNKAKLLKPDNKAVLENDNIYSKL